MNSERNQGGKDCILICPILWLYGAHQRRYVNNWPNQTWPPASTESGTIMSDKLHKQNKLARVLRGYNLPVRWIASFRTADCL
jgi:hypothetical protein